MNVYSFSIPVVVVVGNEGLQFFFPESPVKRSSNDPGGHYITGKGGNPKIYPFDLIHKRIPYLILQRWDEFTVSPIVREFQNTLEKTGFSPPTWPFSRLDPRSSFTSFRLPQRKRVGEEHPEEQTDMAAIGRQSLQFVKKWRQHGSTAACFLLPARNPHHTILLRIFRRLSSILTPTKQGVNYSRAACRGNDAFWKNWPKWPEERMETMDFQHLDLFFSVFLRKIPW